MVLALGFCALLALPGVAGSEDLHAGFEVLLDRFVEEGGVHYAAWADDPAATDELSRYVGRLESAAPSGMGRDEALAYWINLYNAVTLRLVLDHYPVQSIKDTAGFLRSPWKKQLVTVEGTELSLDAIENEVIRPQFRDARIHFALNCASVGCPPLAREAYRASTLGMQLDAACRRALNDPRWVRLEGDVLHITKIFDWYRDDFVDESGAVIAFIARYRSDGAQIADRADRLRIQHDDYDWNLNEIR